MIQSMQAGWAQVAQQLRTEKEQQDVTIARLEDELAALKEQHESNLVINEKRLQQMNALRDELAQMGKNCAEYAASLDELHQAKRKELHDLDAVKAGETRALMNEMSELRQTLASTTTGKEAELTRLRAILDTEQNSAAVRERRLLDEIEKCKIELDSALKDLSCVQQAAAEQKKQADEDLVMRQKARESERTALAVRNGQIKDEVRRLGDDLNAAVKDLKAITVADLPNSLPAAEHLPQVKTGKVIADKLAGPQTTTIQSSASLTETSPQSSRLNPQNKELSPSPKFGVGLILDPVKAPYQMNAQTGWVVREAVPNGSL